MAEEETKKNKKLRRKPIKEEIEVPESMKVELVDNIVKISKGSEAIEKKISYIPEIKDNKITFENKKPTKMDKKMIKSSLAHIANIINGLEEKYVYKLQICSAHFPMNVKVEGKEIIIKNFLGEVKDRKAKILDNVEVKIEGEEIKIESSDKDKAGQTAANIESATKINNRDRRIFQDGIYITEKQKGRKK